MSAAPARVLPTRVPVPPVPKGRGSLRIVPPAVTGKAARGPFLIVVVAMLAAGLLGLLALNTLLAQDAFRLHELQASGKALDEREQALEKEVEALQAPASLAARATALGMVPGGPPAFLRLPDGSLLGQADPETPEAPVVPPLVSTAKPLPKPAAAAAGTAPDPAADTPAQEPAAGGVRDETPSVTTDDTAGAAR
jgi:hypothetical protein